MYRRHQVDHMDASSPRVRRGPDPRGTSGSATPSERSFLDRLRKSALPYLFVGPMAVAVIAIVIVPILRNVWMSFFDWYLARPTAHPFVGLENYTDILSDPVFRTSARVTAIYIGVTLPARFFLGLGIALLFNSAFRGRGLARSMLIIPWAIPEVVACLVWIQMFDPQYGIVNSMLARLHVISDPIPWLTSTKLALPAAMLVNIWKGTPWAAIMLLAGLQSIPPVLYEAAVIDGAGTWNKFRYVTWPLLKPVSLMVFLLLVIWTVKDFAIVYVLTLGGPAHATEVLTIYVYRKAFEGLRMGQATAAGTLLLLFSLIFTILYLRALGREESAY